MENESRVHGWRHGLRRMGVRGLRRSMVAAVVALLATMSLTACSPDQLGAAAIVDGTVVSTDTLQSSARAYLDIVPNADRTQVQQRILERIILSRIIAKAARDNDVHVSTGAVAKQRDLFFQQTKTRRGLVAALASQNSVVVPPAYVDQWVRDQLLVRAIVTKLAAGGDPSTDAANARGTQALSATAKTMKIEINPRYGTWDPQRGIEAQLSGGLAKTAKQLTATK
jgi:hypothetical protein